MTEGSLRQADDSGLTNPRLRVAVLADRLSLGVWQQRVLELLRDAGDTELMLVLINDGAPSSNVSLRSRLLDRKILWRLYNNKWVARRSRAVERVESPDLFAGVRIESTTPIRRGRYSQHLAEDALEQLREQRVDIILRFGFGILRGEVLDLPRFGVWSFHHDDERVIRGGPPSFWEVFEDLPTTGVLLQRLTDRLDGGVPLARATFRTRRRSYPANRDQALLGAAVLPARCARAARLGLLETDGAPTDSAASIRRDPTNGEMLRFLSRQAVRVATEPVKSIMRGQRWQVGVLACDGDPVTSVLEGGAQSIRWIDDQVAHGYLADPFPQRRDGRLATLVEQFDELTARGVISAVEHRDDGDHLHAGVIDPGVHSSYPFLLEHDGELYCIPETWQLGRVEAWRSAEFPTRWVKHCTVLDHVALIDPTIFEWDGRWWLLGTRKEQGPDDTLHAWFADAPFGPWTPHQLNPIKIDVTSSRPAGTPYVVDGILYRPAQDCSTGYGAAVVVNRVDRLDPTSFIETPVHRVDAAVFGRQASVDASLDGVHTISSGGGIVSLDARRPVVDRYRSWRELSARVRRRLPFDRAST